MNLALLTFTGSDIAIFSNRQQSNQYSRQLSVKAGEDLSEWKLHPKAFLKICQTFRKTEIELLAFRLSHQVPQYINGRQTHSVRA